MQSFYIDWDDSDSNHNWVDLIRSSGDGFAVEIIPFLNSSNSNQSKSGGSCGVTFLSKHYAITAAHCLDAIVDPVHFAFYPGGGFWVKQIDTTNLNVYSAYNAGTITGTWTTGWTHSYQMTSSDGYNVTQTMACYVLYRCDDPNDPNKWGPRQCPPIPLGTNVDIGMIYCPNRTATAYLEARNDDPTSGVVRTYWFHEVLNLQTFLGDPNYNTPSGNWDNYGKYDGKNQNNVRVHAPGGHVA